MTRRLVTGLVALFLTFSAFFPSQWMARPLIHLSDDDERNDESVVAYAAGYTPTQIRHAYGTDKLTATGAGQTIAIVVAYGSPTIAEDVAVFNRQFGLPAAELSVAYPSGRPLRVNGGWAQETALDVQWAHAIAPAAKLLLVVAPSPSSRDMLAAVDFAVTQGATTVSNSWGGPEFAGQANLDRHFRQPGVVFVAASGDHGSGAYWPAASPEVLAVGGTRLNLDQSGHRTGVESAWAGSGGGRSAYHPAPAYQKDFGVKGEQRSIPDVAAVADPQTGVAVYSSTAPGSQKGWFMMGGTSLAAPLWAGFIALANQDRTAALSQVHDQLYALARGTGQSKRFHDVTAGSNGNCGRPCTAARGYDTVTGLGSPTGDALIPALSSVGRPRN